MLLNEDVLSKTAGVVILFNSSEKSLKNILTYLPQINRLYIVDNSIETPFWIGDLLKYEDVEYIPLYNNKGVAFALNLGASRAILHGYKYLLTMDDDTYVGKGYVEHIFKFFNNYNFRENVSLISANHSKKKGIAYNEVSITMTSGNILNLDVYKKIGPFDEKLFIDHVDHEYCLRSISKGYKIIELTELQIFHELGALKKFRFPKFKITYHSPIRGYYSVRNGLYVFLKYFMKVPKISLLILKLIMIETCKILILDRKYERIKYILFALFDFSVGKFGRYE